MVRQQSGLRLILHGAKKSDGGWRRRQLKAAKDDHIAYPLAAWNKWDTLAYLRSRGIPASEKFDIDLGARCLLWLHADHPEDFARVCAFYPFAEAVVRRREWYGKGA
jgi:hypothetical protein